MSLKCTLTLSDMQMVLPVTPRASISFNELFFVLPVVPNPGIVTAIISFTHFPIDLKARYVTSNASAESSPPEIPITAVFALVCFNLFSSPLDCIFKISSVLSDSLKSSSGTKGVLENLRSNAPFAFTVLNILSAYLWSPYLSCLKNPPDILRRSAIIFSTSISLYKRPFSKSLLSARTTPFSAIMLCPANTISVVLSPSPASQ